MLCQILCSYSGHSFLITKELSSEKYVSISKLILIKKQLYIFTDSFQDEGGITGTLCTELRLQLNKYLHKYEMNKRYSISALLNPRFRELSFQNGTFATQTCNELINVATPLDCGYRNFRERFTMQKSERFRASNV